MSYNNAADGGSIQMGGINLNVESGVIKTQMSGLFLTNYVLKDVRNKLIVQNSRFLHNDAASSGGFLSTVNFGFILVIDSDILHNGAKLGGAISGVNSYINLAG